MYWVWFGWPTTWRETARVSAQFLFVLLFVTLTGCLCTSTVPLQSRLALWVTPHCRIVFLRANFSWLFRVLLHVSGRHDCFKSNAVYSWGHGEHCKQVIDTGYRCSFWFLMIHVFGLHSSLIEIERIGKCKKNSIHVRNLLRELATEWTCRSG